MILVRKNTPDHTVGQAHGIKTGWRNIGWLIAHQVLNPGFTSFLGPYQVLQQGIFYTTDFTRFYPQVYRIILTNKYINSCLVYYVYSRGVLVQTIVFPRLLVKFHRI